MWVASVYRWHLLLLWRLRWIAVCEQAQTTGSSCLHKSSLMAIWPSALIHIVKLLQKATVSVLRISPTAKSISIKLLVEEVHRQKEAVSKSEVTENSSWDSTAQVNWQAGKVRLESNKDRWKKLTESPHIQLNLMYLKFFSSSTQMSNVDAWVFKEESTFGPRKSNVQQTQVIKGVSMESKNSTLKDAHPASFK